MVFYSQPKYAYIELKTFWGQGNVNSLADTEKFREPAVSAISQSFSCVPIWISLEASDPLL